MMRRNSLIGTTSSRRDWLYQFGKQIPRIAGVAAFGSRLWSQDAVRLAGSVKDEAGALLAGVTVTATNRSTGVTATTLTNSSGDYLFTLPAGRYDIRVVATDSP